MDQQRRSLLCRQQEANHREIASSTMLPNVKRVALAAALAWGREAEEAEALESGVKSLMSDEDVAITLEFWSEDGLDQETEDDDDDEVASK